MNRRTFLTGTTVTALGPALHAFWRRMTGVSLAPVPSRPPPASVDIPDVPARFATDITDLFWRDYHRRRIGDEAFDTGFKRMIALMKQIRTGGITREDGLRRMQAVHDEALISPPPPRDIPPLAPHHVGVDEVTTLLRQILSGEIRLAVDGKWSDVCHTTGTFRAGGWIITAFRRSYGIRYIDTVTSPDKRTGTYELFDAREGNPCALLTNEEQDALDDIIESA